MPLAVPLLPAGAYELVVASSSRAGHHEDRARVDVVAGLAVDVRLDRAEHLPGEPLRWSGVVRWRGSAHPAADVPLRARVRAPKGRVVWEASLRADALGRVAGVFADTRAPGPYEVELRVPGVAGRARAQVHAGPRTPLGAPGPPGPRLTARAVWSGRGGDGVGRTLAIVTMDEAGHLAPARLTVTLRSAPKRGAAGATTERYSPGLVVLPLPKGRVSFRVEVREAREAREAPVQGAGRGGHGAVAPVVPLATVLEDEVPAAGASEGERSWRERGLALPRVVVAPGEGLEVPCDPAPGAQVVSLLDGRAPVAAAWCQPGAATVTLHVPLGEGGLRVVRRVWVSRSPGRVDPELARAHPARARRARRQPRETRGAYVFVAPPPPLGLALTWSPRRGAPGPLTVRVTDGGGRGVAGAAVRVRVVDAVVEELSPQPRELGAGAAAERPRGPWPEGRWRELFRRPRYSPLALRAVEAVLRAVDPPRPAAPEVVVPARQRWVDEGARLRRVFDLLVRRATRRPGAVDALSPTEILRRPPSRPPRRRPSRPRRARVPRWVRDPWGRPPTWAYLTARHPSMGPAALAMDVTWRRLEAVERRLRRRRLRWRWAFLGPHARPPAAVLARALRGAPWMVWDGWGTPFAARVVDGGLELRAAGPDRAWDTPDDVIVPAVLDPSMRGTSSTCSSSSWHSCRSARGVWRGGILDTVSASASPGVRLPRGYDATLAWAPDLVTGADGRVTLPLVVPAAAAPTARWRVEVEAWTATGATGHGVWHRSRAR